MITIAVLCKDRQSYDVFINNTVKDDNVEHIFVNRLQDVVGRRFDKIVRLYHYLDAPNMGEIECQAIERMKRKL